MWSFLRKIMWFVVLVFLQVLIFNQIHLFGVATPFVYVYFVLCLHKEIGKNWLLLLAFAMGIILDLLVYTPGLNAGATVFMAFVRPVFLHLQTPRDLEGDFSPTSRTMGWGNFFRYAFCCVFVHHALLVCLEYFSFDNPLLLLIRILSCTFLTMIFVCVCDLIERR